jgi:PhzF family phenazine biosynthesis protein
LIELDESFPANKPMNKIKPIKARRSPAGTVRRPSTQKVPIYWIDAFTRCVGQGNPAAVVPLEQWIEDAVMQRIAFENGLSETAFLVRTGKARYHLRWFTPAIEIDLCGHATLASGFLLLQEFGLSAKAITFDSRSGPLVVTRSSDDRIELDFPLRSAEGSVEPPDVLVRGLGRAPESVVSSPGRWLCIYKKAGDVSGLRPDHSLLAKVKPGRIIATAPGDGDCDFVSRYFAPAAGIPEDPVTGSAHCTLTPYWAARLGRTSLHARQVSARGGELWCALAGQRVTIAGHAVMYLRGEIVVPSGSPARKAGCTR